MAFNCIVCDGSRADTRRLPDAKDGEEIEIALCQTCGLVQLVHDLTKERLSEYYKTEYRLKYRKSDTPKPRHVYRAGKAAMKRLRKISGYSKAGARLLDIGAGGGEFTFLAGKLGYISAGIDPSSGYLEYARENYGANLRSIDLDQLEPDEKYDLITLFHVLEHLPDPLGAIKSIAGHLENGGIFFVEVPDLRSRDTSPYNFFHKAHLSYFSDLTLRDILEEDFEVLEIDSGRVLQMILRKRASKERFEEGTIADRRRAALELSRRRWNEKTAMEYLLHGALLSPFRKVFRMVEERIHTRGRSAREILEAMS